MAPIVAAFSVVRTPGVRLPTLRWSALDPVPDVDPDDASVRKPPFSAGLPGGTVPKAATGEPSLVSLALDMILAIRGNLAEIESKLREEGARLAVMSESLRCLGEAWFWTWEVIVPAAPSVNLTGVSASGRLSRAFACRRRSDPSQ